MGLKFISFASGSKGNCSLVMTDNTAVLIDAGITVKRLTEELAKLGLLENIKGQGYFMPQKVIDAVAIIDMEYYWPNEKTIILAEHKKEVFWRLCHE